ncbi:TPA: hypothetical protein ACNICG_003447 [Acinetobacter baumannii]
MFKNEVFSTAFSTGEKRNLQMPEGKIVEDVCIANIGYSTGNARSIPTILCDGANSNDPWSIYNVEANGKVQQMAVVGAVSEDQERRLLSRYFLPLVSNAVIHSSQQLTDGGMKRFLDSATTLKNTQYLLESDAIHFNTRITEEPVAWEDSELKSHNGSLKTMLFDMVRQDDHADLIERMTPRDIAALVIDENCEVALHDAIVIKYREFDRLIDQIANQLKELGDKTFYVEEVTKLKPFKRLGVVNVAAVFTMSDTQTITVILNNPDSTPAKLSQDDVLTSWKWILNRRDVTAALQPRAVDSKKYKLIATRMIKLLVNNHPRFVRAQAEKLRIQAEFDQTNQALANANSELTSLDEQINEQQKLIDEFAQQQQAKLDNQISVDTAIEPEGQEPSGLTKEGADVFHENLKAAIDTKEEVVLTGNELGDFPATPEGMKELRNAAKLKLTEMIGQWFDCPALGGPVEIRKSGVKKVISFSGDARKLKIVCALKELFFIARKTDELSTYATATEQNIKAYHILEAPLTLEEHKLKVRFVVREDDKGQYHYDHTISKDVLQNAKSPLLDGLFTVTVPKSGVSQEELAKLARNGRYHLDSIIGDEFEAVNPMILDDATTAKDEVMNIFIIEDVAPAEEPTDVTTPADEELQPAEEPADDSTTADEGQQPADEPADDITTADEGQQPADEPADDITTADEGQQPAEEPQVNLDKEFLANVINGSVNLAENETGAKLEAIGENLPEELEELFNQAAEVYAQFAITNAAQG